MKPGQETGSASPFFDQLERGEKDTTRLRECLGDSRDCVEYDMERAMQERREINTRREVVDDLVRIFSLKYFQIDIICS